MPSRIRTGILGIPYDEKSSFQKGASRGPEVIMQTLLSEAYNLFSENGTDTSEFFTDLGLCQINDYWDIEKEVRSNLNEYPKLLLLGGDHSITFPTVRAFHDSYGPFDILHIDAHPDLYNEFMGDPYSHA